MISCEFLLPNLDEAVVTAVQEIDAGIENDAAVTSPPLSDKPSEEHERERRKPEIAEEDLNDDDVSIDDRLDVASLGDGSDDEILKSDEDDDAGSPFSREVIVPPGNPSNDVITEQRDSRSAVVGDQVGSLVFTNQVRLSCRV